MLFRRDNNAFLGNDRVDGLVPGVDGKVVSKEAGVLRGDYCGRSGVIKEPVVESSAIAETKARVGNS